MSLLSPHTPAVTLSIHDTDRSLRIPLPLALLAGQKEEYFSKTWPAESLTEGPKCFHRGSVDYCVVPRSWELPKVDAQEALLKGREEEGLEGPSRRPLDGTMPGAWHILDT